jgi:IS30 family transposase
VAASNRLVRQFFPKGTNLSVYGREDILDAECKLSKSLEWRKLSEKMAVLIALTGRARLSEKREVP